MNDDALRDKIDPDYDRPISNHEQAKMFIQWALQESYGMAVKVRGITDWSKASQEDQDKVEDYQIRIAELIMWGVRFP